MKGIHLVINTAFTPYGFGLFCGNKCLFSACYGDSRGFSERLLDDVQARCIELGYGLSDVSHIGVVTGPGSYTGIRLGVTYAKLLGFSLGVRVYGYGALDVVAFQLRGRKSSYMVILPSKRGFVYMQLFCSDGTAFSDMCHVSADQWHSVLSKFEIPIQVCGIIEDRFFEWF